VDANSRFPKNKWIRVIFVPVNNKILALICKNSTHTGSDGDVSKTLLMVPLPGRSTLIGCTDLRFLLSFQNCMPHIEFMKF
jgi:hypothetical protein